MTGSAPYSVLITDDDEGCRTSIQSVLAPGGFRTFLARDGREAVRISMQEEIDLAFMDVHLPGISGPEAWVQIREQRQVELPCVFVTGDTEAATRLGQDFFSSPRQMVLLKPLSKDRVLRAVEVLLDYL